MKKGATRSYSQCSDSSESLVTVRQLVRRRDATDSQEFVQAPDGLENQTRLEPAALTETPRGEATCEANVCKDAIAPEVADVALLAASLLSRAAQHIEMFEAEQQRLHFTMPQQRRHLRAPSVSQHTTASCPTTGDSGEPFSPPTDFAGAIHSHMNSTKCDVKEDACRIAGTVAETAVDPKRRAQESAVSNRRRGAVATPSGTRTPCPSSVSDMSMSHVGRSDSGPRHRVRFRELDWRDASQGARRRSQTRQENTFAWQLHQLQHRHLRRLQRQQPHEDQAERAHEADTGRDASKQPLDDGNRPFTRHGLRLKAAALFKDAVRRGVLAGTVAEELKAQIGTTLYEAPSRKAKEEAVLRECTFRPKINKSVPVSRLGKVPWWERLHAEARRILDDEEVRGQMPKMNSVWEKAEPLDLHCGHHLPDGQEIRASSKLTARTSNGSPGRRLCHAQDKNHDGTPANLGKVKAVSSSLRLSRLGSSAGSPLASQHAYPSGRSTTRVSIHPSYGTASDSKGRELLVRYLGAQAQEWLGSYHRKTSPN